MNLKEIKDAARQAFRDQQTQDTEGGVPDAVSFIAGFLAGARHLQNAYETLDAHDEMLIATVDKLKEENKKLIAILRMVENNSLMPHKHEDYYTRLCCLSERASEVLKEIGKE